MNDTFASLGLLALLVVTLLAMRKRGLHLQLASEAVLLGAISLYFGLHGAAPVPHHGGYPDGVNGAWLRSLAVVWWLVAAKLVVNLTLVYHSRDPRSRDARLFSELMAAVIYITAALIVLNSVLELPVNGLLATSGVIAIVLGLALQSTLADVFSGIAVGLEKPFHVGDRVSLAANEGVIVEINWRSLRIRTDGEDLVTIPNTVVAKGQIINRSVPTRRRADTVEITIPSAIPSELMLELMRRATLLCPEILSQPAPVFLLRRSGLYSATYAVIYFIADSPILLAAKSTLLRQIRRLLYHGGIGTKKMTAEELLGSLVLFEALTEAELKKLAGALVMHSVEPGTVVFEQGSIGTSIYVIDDGVLELSRSEPATGTNILGRVGAGEYIGELGLITGAARGVEMKALTYGRVLEIPGESLQHLLQSNARLSAAMECSVRKGLALLDRDDAAREAQPDEHGPDLLARIKAFFKQSAGAQR